MSRHDLRDRFIMYMMLEEGRTREEAERDWDRVEAYEAW